jgi:hypothetical protein
MKATIQDQGVLDSISPMELAAYLRGNGWSLAERRERYTLWTQRTEGDDEFEVLVPSTERLRDYALRMSAALSVLETIEQRSQISIVNDLNQTAADVIRFGLADDESAGGVLPVDYGVRLLQTARDAMLAAACAAVEPLPMYHTRKPAEATSYLSRLQLGQTEVGSFVVTLLSKVPPALHAPRNGQLFETPEEPFNRRVTTGLLNALATAKEVAQSVQITGELEPFRAAVEAGVSANLCRALSSISEQVDIDGLDISCSFAPSRPIAGGRASVIKFSPDDLTILDEAARWLKDLGNVEEYVLYGSVVALESEDADEGKVVVAGLVDDRPRRVHMELERPWYGLAIQAHARHHLVRAIGDISKQGRSWVMTAMQSFSVPELGED